MRPDPPPLPDRGYKQHGIPLTSNRMDGDECPICLSLGGGGAESHTETVCGHHFHIKCLGKWIKSGNTSCPVCRVSLGFIMENARLLYVPMRKFVHFKFIIKVRLCHCIPFVNLNQATKH